MELPFQQSTRDLWRTAVQVAVPGVSPFGLMSMVYTGGIGPEATPELLQQLMRPTRDSREEAIQRVAFYPLIAKNVENLTDPISGLHTFETIPEVSDPRLSVWIDFLANHQQAYLTLEIRKASQADRDDLQAAIRDAILQKRKHSHIPWKGIHVKVTPALGENPHFQSNAASSRNLIYGSDSQRFETLAAKTKALFVADDLDERTAKLKQAQALSAALYALLRGDTRRDVKASQLLNEHVALAREIAALVEQAA